MKQITTRKLMAMPKSERDELMKESFEMGSQLAGRNGEFIPKGVYLPMAEYKRLKGDSDE
jgi:hypothetical protein